MVVYEDVFFIWLFILDISMDDKVMFKVGIDVGW